MAEEKYVLVEHLSSIFDLIKKIDNVENTEEVIKILQEKDTRKTFFKMLASSLRIYYLGLDSIFIASKIDFEKLNISATENIHVKNFSWVLDPKYQKDSYLTILKMNLINDCWICFESSLRDINYKCNIENGEPKIYSLYTNKLFNANTKFLYFFSCCRNAMHNNSIHTKEDYEYILNGKSFKLEKGKKIEFITDQVILEMVEKLSDVALDMWKNLNNPCLISDRYNVI